ncbi:metH, partial [Symbiodinium sp. KB8]
NEIFQRYKFEEEDFRGERFKDHPTSLKGNSDILNLTQEGAISKIHEAYLESGADILGTNTFSGTRTAQADYAAEEWVFEINKRAAEIAKAAAAKYSTAERPRLVAGSIGPTNRTLR